MAVAAPPESAGSVPPHNEEAEASVLGAILLTEQALDGVLLEIGLRPEHFYRPRHQHIFEAMIRLKEKSDPEAVDALTVSDHLRSQGVLEEAGGEAYVHSLPTVVPAVGAVLDYARIVRDDALMRGILDTTRQIQTEVLAHRGEPRELIERAEAALFKIGHEGGMAEMRSIESVLHEEIDKLEELSRKDIGLTGTPSGFSDIDDLTGGFQPGNLIVLAARPSMGKSTLATNIAENAAIEHGKSVALFSLEMSETELAHRFIASQAKVSSDNLRKGLVKADRWPKVLRAVEKLAAAPIFIDDSSENRATGLSCSMAAFSAMLVASVLLPIEGRAASTIRLPGWNPPVRSSMSLKPDGVPVRPMSLRESSSSLSISSWRTASIVRISAMPPSWPILKRAASARSIRSRGSPRWARTSAWMWRVVSRMPRMRASSRTMRA